MRCPALELCREHGVDAIITSTLARAPRTTTATGGRCPGSTSSASPSSSRPSSRSRADVARRRRRTVAARRGDRRRHPRVRRPHHRPDVLVQGGGRRRRGAGGEIVATEPIPSARSASPRWPCASPGSRHAPDGEQAGGDRAVRVPDEARRLGNAVGLDTPASAIELLARAARPGYRVDRIPPDGDALMAELADGFTYDQHAADRRAARARAPGRWPSTRTREWFATLPDDARAGVESMWGPPPGEVYVDGGALALPGHRPRRRARHDPAAREASAPIRSRTYHAPGHAAAPPLPRLLPVAGTSRRGWGATRSSTSASTARSSGCRARRSPCPPPASPTPPSADVPLFYPFVVNDPGEGTQAKRRAHAVIDRPPPAAAHPRRHLRRARPPGAAARRVRQVGDGPGQAAGAAGPGVGPARRRRDPPRPRARRRAA